MCDTPLLSDNKYKELLIDDAKSLGIVISDLQAYDLLLYLDLMLKKNEVINLTRISTYEDAIHLHLIDSLLVYKVVRDLNLNPRSFIDMGTGAGFPGFPFGYMMNIPGVLLDSTKKKIACVQEFVYSVQINTKLRPVHSRVEEFAKRKTTFDLVMARAVAQSNVLLEYASPLQNIGGYSLIAKANISDEEFDNAQRAASICGYSYVSRETFELPQDKGHREILVYKKTSQPQIKLPRKNGLAKQQPLGLK